MIVISREKGEAIMFGDNIKVIVKDIKGDKIKLIVDAPDNVPVCYKEDWEKIQSEKKKGAKL